MAYKTMLRQLISKWGIMSIDMQNAMESDMAVIHEDGTKDYADTVSEENIVLDQNLQEAVEETPEDIIRDDENGFLVPLGKVEEYATKLKMLMESEELRTRFEMNAVSDRSKYSMENIGESFFNFMF